jgi:hypothetical protein
MKTIGKSQLLWMTQEQGLIYLEGMQDRRAVKQRNDADVSPEANRVSIQEEKFGQGSRETAIRAPLSRSGAEQQSPAT